MLPQIHILPQKWFKILFLNPFFGYIFIAIICTPFLCHGATFKIVTYNVENLFDMQLNGSEYASYKPNSKFGWNIPMMRKKISNIARVLYQLKADIVALQEVESEKALTNLQEKLNSLGLTYDQSYISQSQHSTVKCAVLSKFPIMSSADIPVDLPGARDIVKIELDINGSILKLYVNHWKSRNGPESMRIKYAQALKKDINGLPKNSDYIVLGDFNSSYNEYELIVNDPTHNDTNGKTGINHILHTLKDGQLITFQMLRNRSGNHQLYNLWLDLKPENRWSHIFYETKSALDNILIPKGLSDRRGIGYVKNSFERFDKRFLFNGKKIFRWKRARKGRGRHLGSGYSDHLPIFATFRTFP